MSEKFSGKSCHRRVMLWVRGLIFLVLVPGLVAVYVPQWIVGAEPISGGWWQAGWLLIGAGVIFALAGMASFLRAGGTPAIFFTRGLRFLWGEEPGSLVRGGVYRYSRNPMYVGVVTVIFGQAVLFRSAAVAVYGAAMFGLFHGVVTLVEEPHLRRRDPEKFARFEKEVPRWLGTGLPG
jgi:protein-S-isoprenylcysteine O-methyltransferase Ste14